ncbi:hypothetical protein [Flavisolibacter ginsenosidimutans]|uniref:Uncharacterized protein n=1 Tax=Flavisolibacter ginsenosidimutans TaxID=661481 RepID=A0A5B8UJ44_9BACT|nr:hypothetical protein [Flavisolibacter ginsenosidimutans]QEC56704.1 hypothetical protein FSB75_12615 [Flavisolibacter ginsenosidimutans]
MTETQLPVSFQLADIQTEQFALIEAAYKETEAEHIKLNSSFRFGFNESDKSILASPRFSFEQKENSFIILEVACIYTIADESWRHMFNAKEHTVTLSKAFAAHIAALSIGTVRGVLHAKTEQTPFNKFMIPLINVAENITEDVLLK